MSETIDHRVVEMRFDNKQFEAGAKQTIGTLSRLKEVLKLPDTGKALAGIDKATKNISLDGISAGVEALNKRFSTLGIVGMRVVENITDGLMNKLNTAVNFVTNSIVSGGIKRAMNIENAHFQLQALLKDETKVQAVMADAMESVDGTAYAYDEAAKAASQFAASGLQSGEEMLGALKGITGVAAMTNSSFEEISMIFTTVAGNGRLMGDQLLQLSGRGLNAASTLANYFKEVRGQADMTEGAIRELVSKGEISFKDFSDAMTWAFGDSAKRANETFTGAMSNMKSALARIGAGFVSPLVEQNGEMVQLFNALRIKINDVKSALVFDEQRSAIAGLTKVTSMTNDELSEMFSNIKKNGKVSIDDLNTITKKGTNATVALTKYVNGVTDGSIRATYAISSALDELTNGTEVSILDIQRFVQEGKISLDIFTSAMEHEFGTEKTLSKQFTDWFLNNLSKLVDVINSTDMTKPMAVFYDWVEIVKNGVKGLISILNPVAKAFANVFFTFDIDDVMKISESIEELTSRMKLSERGSKNLQDAMEGLFSVAKLIVDIFFDLLGALLPINKPVVEMSGGFLDLAGSIGRALKSFTEVIRRSSILKKSFSLLSSGFSGTMTILSNLIMAVRNFITAIAGLEGSTKLVNAISNAFERLSSKITPYIEDFIDSIYDMAASLFGLEDVNTSSILDDISNAFINLANVIDGISFQSIEKAFDSLGNKIQSFINLIMSNDGIATFVTNFGQFGEDLEEAFTIDNLLERIKKVMSVFDEFFNWIRNIMGPAFEDFNAGSVVATGGGLGIIYAMIKAAKAFEKMSNSIQSIPNLLGSVKGTLVAYQQELKAEAILKIALSITALSGALVLLSFADPVRLMGAASALSVVAGVFMGGITAMMLAVNKGNDLNNALTIFSRGLKSTMKKFGRALEIKALGSAVKDFAKSIAIIAVAIIALGVMYKKDKESLMAGVDLVKTISLVMAGIMAAMALLGTIFNKGMKGFFIASAGMLLMSASLTAIIISLNGIFKMEFPSDWKFKVEVLGAMLLGLASLSVVLSLASRIGGKGNLSAATFLSLAVLLTSTISALNKLFKMEFPSDWEEKVMILGGIFAGFGGLMIAMGVAAKLSGGSIKAAGTILSMCLLLPVIVASLLVLSIIPADKMTKGATSLGIVLTTLGAALFGAGKITSKDTYRSILAMAVAIGAITASLAVLAMVPFTKLLTGSVALGTVLTVLALDFREASKLTEEKAWLNIASMVAAILSITLSLYVLSEQPWENLLTSALSLSAVLLAFAQTLKMISDMQGLKIEKIGMFLLATTSLIPVGAALYILSTQPWANMLTSGAALSGTLLALVAAFKIIAMARPNLVAIGTFLAASVSVGLIALSLYELAKQPWEGLLGAAASLSLVIISLTAAMAICSAVGSAAPAALVGIALLDAFIANFVLILVALNALFSSEEARSFLSGGAEVLVQIGEAIGDFVGAIINGALTGISSALPKMGTDLSAFMTNLQPFIEGSKSLDAKALGCVAILAGVFIALTAAEVINGITNLFHLSLVDVAIELSKFMTALQPFIIQSRLLSEDSMRACMYLATMIITLTASELIAGISKIFGLSGSLSEFGKQLSKFGPYIKEFADTVKDVKPEAVQGAAAAAEIMADLAKKLPGTEGFVQKIFGTKSLSEFGKELDAFGPSIVDFADTVKDVKPEAVQGAAAAAEIMAEVASKLPAQEGYVNKIFGSKSLKEFGKELDAFGPSIVDFADTVKDVKPEAVQGTASVTSIMSSLANNLPASDTLWDKLFGGGQSISEFGKELVKFGESMTKFADSVSGIKVGQMDGAITGFKELVELSEFVQNASATELVNFSKELSNVASDAIDDFVDVFYDSGARARYGIRKLFDYASKGIERESKILGTKMTKNAKYIVDGLVKGLENGQKSLKLQAQKMAQTIDNTFCALMEIRSPSRVMKERGDQIDQGLAIGVEEGSSSVIDSVTSVGNAVIDAVTTSLSFSNTKDTFASGLGDIVKVTKDSLSNVAVIKNEAVANEEEVVAKNKELNEESLANENEYWERLLEMKKNASKDDKYNDIEMVDFQKDVLKSATDIYKEYIDQFSSTRDSIMNSVDLFSEVTKKESVGKDVLKKNLQDQIKLYEEYGSTLNDLNNRLDGTEMIEYLRTLGVDSTEELKTINSMTDEELSEYVNLYDQKLAAANVAAANQLKGLQTETENKLSELFGTIYSSVDLLDFAKVFDGSLESLNSYLQEFIIPVEELGEQMQEEGEEIATDFVDTFEETITPDAFKDIGSNVVIGLIEGIQSMRGEIEEVASEIAESAVDATKEAFDEHSPSKIAFKIGKFYSIGLANGINNQAKAVSEAGSKVANNAVDLMRDTIDKLKEFVNSDDYSINPTIRPVVDLSDVRKSSDDISKLFNKAVGISTTDDISKLFNKVVGISAMTASSASSTMPKNTYSNEQQLNDNLKKLAKSIENDKNKSNSYYINGITYRENDDLEIAVKSLINAVKVQRRV